MIAVIKELDGVGPLIGRKGVEALHLGAPTPVCQEAEHTGDNDRIVEPLVCCIGLTDNDNAGAFFRMEEALHRGKLNRLVVRDLLPFCIATGIKLDDAGDEPCDYSQGDKQPGVVGVPIRQQVVGSQAGHGEGSGDHCPTHDMHVLR